MRSHGKECRRLQVYLQGNVFGLLTQNRGRATCSSNGLMDLGVALDFHRFVSSVVLPAAVLRRPDPRAPGCGRAWCRVCAHAAPPRSPAIVVIILVLVVGRFYFYWSRLLYWGLRSKVDVDIGGDEVAAYIMGAGPWTRAFKKAKNSRRVATELRAGKNSSARGCSRRRLRSQKTPAGEKRKRRQCQYLFSFLKNSDIEIAQKKTRVFASARQQMRADAVRLTISVFKIFEKAVYPLPPLRLSTLDPRLRLLRCPD